MKGNDLQASISDGSVRDPLSMEPLLFPSHPDRTRISCHAALDMAACAAFVKEGSMRCTNATKFHRKSGRAKRRDLRFRRPSVEMFFDRA
jgi:hypothetical protein